MNRRDWIKGTSAFVAGAAISGRSANVSAQTQSSLSSARYPELKYINLAGNENPFGPSRQVTMTIMREIANSCRYPFREEQILVERLAELEGVDPSNILLGNGCDEILSLCGELYGRPGNAIVATRPTYLQLMHHAEKKGAYLRWIAHDEAMRHDLAKMRQAVNNETSLVYVCNPDTPSGTYLQKDELRAFCEQATLFCPVFLDEVYLDLLEDYRERTLVELVRDGMPVIIGRSFSKMHGLAGHRVGYAVAPSYIIDRLRPLKMSSMNYLGVMAALASIADTEFHKSSAQAIRSGRESFCQLLSDLQLAFTPSVGNFVFHHTGIPIRKYEAIMKARGFLVGRPFEPYEDWCRISIGSPAEMSAFSFAMEDVFGDMS